MTDDIVARLRDIEGGYSFRAICREAADEIERLRAERDIARRTLCYEYYLARGCKVPPEVIAEEMGWDCFGESWKMMQDALDKVSQLGEDIENGEA